MELVSTMEINGEEREIADAVAREQCAANAEGIDNLNSNLSQLEIDLKMLGYTVPKEMPVQNYVDSDGVFHQRVGRVDLGSLSWNYYNSLFTSEIVNTIKPTGADSNYPSGYCIKYEREIGNNFTNKNKVFTFAANDGRIFIKDSSYTDAATFKNAMKGVYLYYELATEKTISVDGNEAVTKVNDSLSQLDISQVDLKMLGWSVPKECPIQNEVNGNQFTQNVNRIDMGEADWQNHSTDLWMFPIPTDANKPISIGYSPDFEIFNASSFANTQEGKINLGHGVAVFYRNSQLSDVNAVKSFMNGKYLYYKLSNLITKTIDGNEVVVSLKNDLYEKLKVISVSLSDVMVSAMSSTTVDLPQEYIDAGYVIANILSKPDTGLSYTTGSETSIIIRNNTDSAVAFAPTTTVKVLIAKIG